MEDKGSTTQAEPDGGRHLRWQLATEGRTLQTVLNSTRSANSTNATALNGFQTAPLKQATQELSKLSPTYTSRTISSAVPTINCLQATTAITSHFKLLGKQDGSLGAFIVFALPTLAPKCYYVPRRLKNNYPQSHTTALNYSDSAKDTSLVDSSITLSHTQATHR